MAIQLLLTLIDSSIFEDDNKFIFIKRPFDVKANHLFSFQQKFMYNSFIYYVKRQFCLAFLLLLKRRHTAY